MSPAPSCPFHPPLCGSFRFWDATLSPEQHGPFQEGHYLGEDSILAAGVQGRVVSVLHSQASVNIEPRHEIGLAGLRVLQTLGNESCAPLGQQQELLDMLPTGRSKMSEVPSVQNMSPTSY